MNVAEIIIIILLLLNIGAYIDHSQKLNSIIMTQAELAQQLTDLKAQIDKVNTEVQNDLQKLADAIANQGNASQEVQDALAALQNSVKAVDDLNPDA